MRDGPSRRSRPVEVEAGELFVEEAGDGPAVVLSHGGLTDRHLWDELFASLARDHHAVRYDLRGHGASTTGAVAYRPYEDLAAVLDALGLARADLLGHAQGAGASLDLALTAPERANRLVLVAPVLDGAGPTEPDERARLEALGRRVASAYERGEFARASVELHQVWSVGDGRSGAALPAGAYERLLAMTEADLERPLGESGARAVGPVPPSVGRLRELAAPTLVVVGERDLGFVRATAERISREARTARRVVLDGAAHHLPLERPEELERLVRTFLDAPGRDEGAATGP